MRRSPARTIVDPGLSPAFDETPEPVVVLGRATCIGRDGIDVTGNKAGCPACAGLRACRNSAAILGGVCAILRGDSCRFGVVSRSIAVAENARGDAMLRSGPTAVAGERAVMRTFADCVDPLMRRLLTASLLGEAPAVVLLVKLGIEGISITVLVVGSRWANGEPVAGRGGLAIVPLVPASQGSGARISR